MVVSICITLYKVSVAKTFRPKLPGCMTGTHG